MSDCVISTLIKLGPAWIKTLFLDAPLEIHFISHCNWFNGKAYTIHMHTNKYVHSCFQLDRLGWMGGQPEARTATVHRS